MWWNYGEDFAVLDATIAHMFQRTPRQRFSKTSYFGNVLWFEPTFKFTSDFYQGERPRELTFSRERVRCAFHLPEGNDLGITCPCRLGNVDLSAILDYICRQLTLGTRREPSLHGYERNRWDKAKFKNNYKNLLNFMMGEDRLYPLLDYLKDAANRFYSKDEFYQSLGPGMEQDMEKMGYNIGDVVGIALIMRFVTTTDDRIL